MKPKEFYDLVKAQREACKAFAATHSQESRDQYFKLSDMIDAEIQRVDKIMEERNNGKKETI